MTQSSWCAHLLASTTTLQAIMANPQHHPGLLHHFSASGPGHEAGLQPPPLTPQLHHHLNLPQLKDWRPPNFSFLSGQQQHSMQGSQQQQHSGPAAVHAPQAVRPAVIPANPLVLAVQQQAYQSSLHQSGAKARSSLAAVVGAVATLSPVLY